MSSSARRWFEPVAAALVVATLLSGRQIASWTTLRNRYHFHWQRSDGVALVIAVLGLAAILYALGLALNRIEWARRRRLPDLALVVAVVAALLTQINPLALNPSPVRALGLWVVVSGALVLAWHRWAGPMSRFVRGACLVMSPLVPMLMVQALLWKPWDVREASTSPGPPPAPGRTPVLIAVFDEWSWLRTAPQGELPPEYVNLRRLAEHATLVTEARSPSFSTRISMPRFLYEEPGHIVIGNGVASWEVDSLRRPAPEVPNLFDRARGFGYRTQLFGYYLPYRALFGPDAPDRILTYSHTFKSPDLAGEVLARGIANLQYWTDPVSKLVWEPYFNARYSENWRDLTRTLEAATLAAITGESDNTLIVSHLPVPHYPFIWNPDGSYRGAFEGDRRSGDAAGYHRNTLYADHILGELLDTLERTGRFDRTLLIVTSDHSWRKEDNARLLAQPDAPRRVPLLIKWPGQRRPLRTDQRYCTMGLGPLLDAALGPSGPAAFSDSLWQVVSEAGRRESCEEGPTVE